MLTITCKACRGEKQIRRKSDGAMIACPGCRGVGWLYLVLGKYPFMAGCSSIGVLERQEA